VSAQSDLERRIQALEPRDFERLAYDLVVAENRDANALTPPDGGADVLVLSEDGRRARVWQAKRHVRSIKWKACEKSLQDAITNYEPESVAFVFAKDLTVGEIKSFERRLREPGARAGVGVSYWGLNAVRSRVQDNRVLRVRHLSYDEQTLLDIFASQRSAANILERTFGLDEVLSAEDPVYEYTVEMLRTEIPEPRAKRTDRVTIIASEGDKHVRVTARPRDVDSGPVMEWRFTDDERGKLARQGALLAVARGDAEVAVESGFEWRFATAPKVMRDTYELTTEASRRMRVVFTPGPAIPLTIAAMRAGGGVSRRELSVYPFPTSGAFTHCYAGLDGAFLPFLGFRVTEGSPHIQMALAPMLEFGENARENAAAARFSLDLVGADDVALSGPLFPERLKRAGPVQPLMPEDIIQLAEYWHAMYESVVFLEDELGTTIPVHPPPFTLDELLNLNQAVEALRTGELDMSFREASVHMHPDTVQMNAAWLHGHPPFFFRVVRTVFGQEIELGRAVVNLPDIRLIELPSLLLTPTPSVKLKLIATGNGDMKCQLLGPDEDPPAGALEVPPPDH